MPIDFKQQLCLDCLECCKYLEFTLKLPNLDTTNELIPFYGAHGCRTKKEFHGTWWELNVLVPCRCKYLTATGCSNYENRSKVCRLYDGRKDPFISDKCKWNELKEE